jgi:anhydro-N-acetylmuramic acid kinase
LLNELMRDSYLRVSPPKSTGREYYGADYLKKVLALGRKYRAKPDDLIRCATIFTALSVVDALNRFVLPRVKIHQLIVSGGGARNPLIMAQLSAALSGVEVIPSSRMGVAEEAKEAFAFAMLAYESFHRRAGNVFSATGASGAAVLGKICYARAAE